MPFYKSAASVRSDSSEVDLEGLAEGELAKLQRQFRLLEGDRHAYTLESHETIRRQMVEVKRLQKENEDLVHRQSVAEGRPNLQREKAHADNLRILLSQRDEVEQQIAEEKKRLAELDKAIQTWQKRSDGRKQVVGSGTLIQEQKVQLQRRIQTMENQLDRASAEFGSQLAMNAQLREDLDVLRLGHDRFEQLYQQLYKELMTTRTAIGAIISTSSVAYDARDEARTRLAQLQDKAKKDLAQYESEMRELNRILDHDHRMSEFIAIKLQERMLTEEAFQAKEKREQERKEHDPQEEMLNTYESTFKRFLKLTSTDNLEVAVEKYTAVDERNFAQFNYVNEQNSRKEQLWEQINELCREIEKVREQGAKKMKEEQLRLQDAELRQEEAVNETKRIELKLKGLYKIWEQLKSAIESLFWKLECDHSVLEKVLGGTTAARDENVPVYLSLIERQTNNLLTMYSYLTAEEQELAYDAVETVQLLFGQKPPIPFAPVHIRPPTAGLSHDAITEEDQRPLTHAELKEKVMKDVLSKAEALAIKKTTNENKKLPQVS
ncbi:outer dynein arm-docking complex subunit 1 [Hemicordylus capensis]|uniref:outer dynein arm-docking complex subunit 1 n=1 Tax=Hemicordylus capensis TaxID=884348 RepID=UPI0023036720|nr:outer dynein arm-docking complex subunit 1 [Hemicordylus capensis]XP_053119467.1 outer dynein arm-docking complex subunit 1 [Hemicordylus capensis]XP_053119468.1 outer dynein arm-docking complex subunit 1 [Hemicordylus capensis]XP_053119469.1 outer dynein arm-docking complex subunit 1 [Hemicordylus capensis]